MKKKQSDDVRIDSVRMKRDIQRQIAAETRGMSPTERLAYYKKLAEESPFKPKALAKSRKGARPKAGKSGS